MANRLLVERDGFGESLEDVEERWDSWLHRIPFDAPVARALLEAGAKTLLLAGRGGKREAKYREAGIEVFVHLGANLLEILPPLLATCGVALPDGGAA